MNDSFLKDAFVYLLAAVLGVPIWVWAGSRFSKHNALIFAVVAARDPRLSEDELLDAAEQVAMVEHPLSR